MCDLSTPRLLFRAGFAETRLFLRPQRRTLRSSFLEERSMRWSLCRCKTFSFLHLFRAAFAETRQSLRPQSFRRNVTCIGHCIGARHLRFSTPHLCFCSLCQSQTPSLTKMHWTSGASAGRSTAARRLLASTGAQQASAGSAST